MLKDNNKRLIKIGKTALIKKHIEWLILYINEEEQEL